MKKIFILVFLFTSLGVFGQTQLCGTSQLDSDIAVNLYQGQSILAAKKVCLDMSHSFSYLCNAMTGDSGIAGGWGWSVTPTKPRIGFVDTTKGIGSAKVATEYYVVSSLGSYLPLAGGNMSGPINGSSGVKSILDLNYNFGDGNVWLSNQGETGNEGYLEMTWHSTNHSVTLGESTYNSLTINKATTGNGALWRDSNKITLQTKNGLYFQSSIPNAGGSDSLLAYNPSTHRLEGIAKSSVGSGTVTNVATGYGAKGGPITTIGTISVDTTSGIGSAKLATEYYVINILGSFLPLAGGTMTGPIIMTGSATIGGTTGNTITFSNHTVNVFTNSGLSGSPGLFVSAVSHNWQAFLREDPYNYFLMYDSGYGSTLMVDSLQLFLNQSHGSNGQVLTVDAHGHLYYATPTNGTLNLVGSNAAMQIPYVKTASNTLRSQPQFSWDSLNHRLGIGTNIPTTDVQINCTGGISNRGLTIYQNSTYNTGLISIFKSKGTYASPSTMSSVDSLFNIVIKGYDGTQYSVAGSLNMYVDGAVSNGIMPSKWEFKTTNLSGTKLVGLTIDHNQNTVLSGTSNNIGTVTAGTISTGTVLGGVTTTLGSDATGDIYYRNSIGILTRLGIGSTNQILTVIGGLPSWQPATATGVTSVGLSLPSIFTVSGSPVTSSGTLTGSLNTQSAHTVLIGPTGGSSAVPTFRILYGKDLISTIDTNWSAGKYIQSNGAIKLTANWDAVKQITADSVILGSAVNTMAGGALSGGSFTINSTTNATKGFINLGGTTGFSYDETNKLVGIGIAPTAGDAINSTANTNGNWAYFIQNNSAGAAAGTAYIVQNNSASQILTSAYSSGYTTSGYFKANSVAIYGTTGSTGAPMLIMNNSINPVMQFINGQNSTNFSQFMYINSSNQMVFGSNNTQARPSGSSSFQFIDAQPYTNILVDGTYPNFQHSTTVGTPASTSQTTLFSDSITANTLSRNGAVLEITQTGQFNATGTITFYFGKNGSSSDSIVLNTGVVTIVNPMTWTMNAIIQRVSNTVINVSYVFNASVTSKSLGGSLLSFTGASGNYQIGNGTALALATTKYYWTVTGTSSSGLTANNETANIGYAKYITPK